MVPVVGKMRVPGRDNCLDVNLTCPLHEVKAPNASL